MKENKYEVRCIFSDNNIPLKYRLEELNNKINIRDKSIDDLKYKLNSAYNEIDDLEEQVSTLEDLVNRFKNLWEKFVEFLKDKFFDSNDYDKVINELKDKEILNKEDINTIYGKEKDDFKL